MDVDYKALQFFLQAANTIGVVLVGIYTWLANRHKVTASAIDAVKESILEDRTLIETRFARIESEITHALTHDDLETVYTRINEMADTLSTLGGQIQQMNQGVHMIHEFLLNQGNKK